MSSQPVPHVHDDTCSDCGTAVGLVDGSDRCPACFERHLFNLDVGFLDSYRKFGARSRSIVAETCLRGLVLASPDHRKVLAMMIFEQYVAAMNDLAGMFVALKRRHEAPILQTFTEFRLDAANAVAFFDAVQNATDVELCQALELPLPGQVASLCTHLDEVQAYQVAVAIYHLVQDLRRATDKGNAGALMLAQLNGQIGGALITEDAKWLNGASSGLTPDQVAMLVLDSKRRSIYVQGLTADEGAMGRVVDSIDTVTRAISNLIYAYLETNGL
jgi:hypothetical protein